MSEVTLHLGDCRDVLPTLPDNSADSIVTDPPYELGFMGKRWDSTGIAYDVNVWRECLRILKPGGHLLAFGGSRTYHRLACAVEDAGFEIRDQIMWIYGSGFPKSLAVDKAIDKAAGAAREVVGVRQLSGYGKANVTNGQQQRFTTQFPQTSDTPATPDALHWQGWGTALKPAHEPIVLARKPIVGTVAANVLTWGCGALNVDGCRVGYGDDDETLRFTTPGNGAAGAHIYSGGWNGEYTGPAQPHPDSARHDARGRFPANVIHDGSDEVVGLFPSAGGSKASARDMRPSNCQNGYGPGDADGWRGNWHRSGEHYGDSGSAARFFKACPFDDEDVEAQRLVYCAKASRADRDEGLEDVTPRSRPTMGNGIGGQPDQARANNRNHHPTVKPTALMRYLCRLVTPPGGVVLDPFMGSGSTGKAAVLEGVGFVGIEKEAEYMAIAERRIAEAQMQPALVEAAQ